MVDARIPLMGRNDVFGQLATGLQERRARKRDDQLFDLTLQRNEQEQFDREDRLKRQAEDDLAAEEGRIAQSIAEGALEAQILLARGAEGAALENLRARSGRLTAQGRDPSDTDEVIGLLEAGRTNEARQLIDSAVEFGQVRGLLPESPKGFTLGQGQTRFDASGGEIASVAADEGGLERQIAELNAARAGVQLETARIGQEKAEREETDAKRTQDEKIAARLERARTGLNLSQSLLQNVDGVTGLFGPIDARLSGLTEESGTLSSQLNQIASMLSIDARGQMKGSGAISDFEAQTLASAETLLAGAREVNLEKTAVRNELLRVATIFERAERRAEQGITWREDPLSDVDPLDTSSGVSGRVQRVGKFRVVPDDA